MQTASDAGELVRETSSMRAGRVAMAGALMALVAWGVPTPAAAHPPLESPIRKAITTATGRSVEAGFPAASRGGVRSFGVLRTGSLLPPQYGIGNFGVSIGLPGYGAIGGGYVQPITQYPPFGVTSIGGLNIGYGAVGGYLPYGVYANGPWSPGAVGYYQPVGPALVTFPPIRTGTRPGLSTTR